MNKEEKMWKLRKELFESIFKGDYEKSEDLKTEIIETFKAYKQILIERNLYEAKNHELCLKCFRIFLGNHDDCEGFEPEIRSLNETLRFNEKLKNLFPITTI